MQKKSFCKSLTFKSKCEFCILYCQCKQSFCKSLTFKSKCEFCFLCNRIFEIYLEESMCLKKMIFYEILCANLKISFSYVFISIKTSLNRSF